MTRYGPIWKKYKTVRIVTIKTYTNEIQDDIAFCERNGYRIITSHIMIDDPLHSLILAEKVIK